MLEENMEEQWQIGFISEFVYKEFMALPKEIKSKIYRILHLIKEEGLEEIGMPYIRHVRGKLWEVRATGRNVIARSLYVTVRGKRVVILRSFIKKTEETPPEEIQISLKRLKEYEGGLDNGFYSV